MVRQVDVRYPPLRDGARGQDVLQFDDIELDLEQYELRRSGRVIKLERQRWNC
jgi:DNA-binding winged helix-turn-helix (wHTH) protein